MLCPSCKKEMDKETVRYHTPSGYERKLVVFECPYDSCSGQDYTEDEARIAALESQLAERDARLKEAEAVIKPFADNAIVFEDKGDNQEAWGSPNMDVTVGDFRRAAEFLKVLNEED